MACLVCATIVPTTSGEPMVWLDRPTISDVILSFFASHFSLVSRLLCRSAYRVGRQQVRAKWYRNQFESRCTRALAQPLRVLFAVVAHINSSWWPILCAATSWIFALRFFVHSPCTHTIYTPRQNHIIAQGGVEHVEWVEKIVHLSSLVEDLKNCSVSASENFPFILNRATLKSSRSLDALSSS